MTRHDVQCPGLPLSYPRGQLRTAKPLI